MNAKKELLTWWPTLLIGLLFAMASMAGAGVESVVLIMLAILQIVMFGVRFMWWGKDVVESAAGMDEKKA